MRWLRKKSPLDEEIDELEVLDVPAVSLPASTPSTLADIEAALTNLKAMKGQLKKSKKELLKLIKEEYPKDLKDIALLLYSMPVTQVSVERLFSALKIYKSDHRNRLKEDVLSSLLILKANA